MNIQRYALNGEQADHLRSRFVKVLDGCRVRTLRSDGMGHGVAEESGCYVWIMRIGSESYSIYVGRTNSIVRRVRDYGGSFQVHSPNDFKLRLVEEALGEVFEAALFDLYFEPCPLRECSDRERSLIAFFRPLVNDLPKPTAWERERVEDAYRAFYRSVVGRHLSEGS
jgi:hypothetical protein